MKILISGGGSIGKRHITNLQSLGYKDLYCLRRSFDPLFDKEFNVKTVVSYEEASAVDCKVIFICSPTSKHLEDLQYAVSRKMHIFMEKPLIHNQSGLDTIIKMMQGYNKVFFIGFMLRYHPLVQKIKDILNEGLIGPIYSARLEFGSYLPYWHPWEDHRISYASRKELGGGVINTITHELDLVQYFFNTPSSLTCTAKNLGKLKIEVEEIAEIFFEYMDKIVSLHLDYLQKDYDRQIRILGDLGRITWNWHDNKVDLKIHKEDVRQFKLEDFNVNQLYIDELKDFLKLIDTNTITHALDFNHAIQNTRLMLTMHQSNEKRRSIKYNDRIII